MLFVQIVLSHTSFAQAQPIVKKNDPSPLTVTKKATENKVATSTPVPKATKPVVSKPAPAVKAIETPKPATTAVKEVKQPKIAKPVVANTNTNVILKKDGTPDKRYSGSQHVKKDGTPDLRYKENKKQ